MNETVRTSLHNPSYGPPKKRAKAKKKSSHRPRGSRSNPGPFVLTLGALGANPTKEKRTVARKKKSKKKSTRAPAKANRSKKSYRAKGGKKNPGVTMAMIKRAMGKSKKKGSGRRKSSRNPFGMPTGEAVANSAAVLGAVTIAKLAPPLFPASWNATDLGRFGTTTLVVAIEAIGAHFLIPRYRNMVLAGGGAMMLSVALNPILRKVSSTITLGRIQQQRRGMNDFVRGNFPEPHNPIYNQMMMAAAMGAPPASGGAAMGRYRGRFH